MWRKLIVNYEAYQNDQILSTASIFFYTVHTVPRPIYTLYIFTVNTVHLSIL